LFKSVMAYAKVPQVEYRAVELERFRADPAAVLGHLAQLGTPAFVNPARLGSSVGIVRVAQPEALEAGLETAFEHDPLVIVEAAAGGIEVECSVIGNGAPIASEPGEIMLASGEGGWYD